MRHWLEYSTTEINNEEYQYSDGEPRPRINVGDRCSINLFSLAAWARSCAVAVWTIEVELKMYVKGLWVERWYIVSRIVCRGGSVQNFVPTGYGGD